jgi:hypothetical protein
MSETKSSLSMTSADKPTQSVLDTFALATRRAVYPWEHVQNLSKWVGRCDQLGTGAFSSGINELWLGPIQIVHEYVDQSFAYVGRAWRGARVLGLSLPTAGTANVDGHRMPQNVLLSSGKNETARMVSNGRFECLVVAIDEQVLLRQVGAVLGSAAPADACVDCGARQNEP